MKSAVIAAILLFNIAQVYSQRTLRMEDVELRTGGTSKAMLYKQGETTPYSGKLVEYYTSDTTSKHIVYNVIKGRMIGTWEKYYESGKLQAKGHYNEDSEQDGKYFEYYENDSIKCTGEYRDDVKQGSWMWYNQDGSFNHAGQYVLGTVYGVWIYKNPDGIVIKEVIYNTNGEIIDVIYPDENKRK